MNKLFPVSVLTYNGYAYEYIKIDFIKPSLLGVVNIIY